MTTTIDKRTTVTLDKVVRIGVERGVNANVYCHIMIKDGKLSISGVIGPCRNGNAKGSCGQIEMHYAHRDPRQDDKRNTHPTLANDFDFAPGWDAEKWLDFLDIWHKWHLNDVQAGCEHQRELGWDDYDKHPSEPCPVCGYKYGSKWLRMELPAEVVAFLQGLPETDRQPAWV